MREREEKEMCSPKVCRKSKKTVKENKERKERQENKTVMITEISILKARLYEESMC